MMYDDFGRYLVYALEKKGKNLSWVMAQKNRDEIIRAIEVSFKKKMEGAK